MGLYKGKQVDSCDFTEQLSVVFFINMVLVKYHTGGNDDNNSKAARLNQPSSVLGVCYMEALIDFSLLLVGNQ